MSDIRTFDEKRIEMASGYITIHISESGDGNYDIEVSEMLNGPKVRIGMRDGSGIHFKFLKPLLFPDLRPAPGERGDAK